MKPSFLINSTEFKKLKKLQRRYPEIFRKAMEQAGIQFMNWANNGSAKEARKPPIRWGVLRGSASVFVADKLVAVTTEGNDGTPALSYSGNPLVITWAWNTKYAAKMHEHQGNWGSATERDGDAGNKWLERHLDKDKDDLMKMIAETVNKSVGKGGNR